MKRLAALALLSCSCLQGVPDDISCLGDQTCPTDWYCNNGNVCRALADGTPPTLKLVGVGDSSGDAAGTTASAPLSGGYIWLTVANTGDQDAAQVGISFDAPPCTGLDPSLPPTMMPYVTAGQSTVVQATVSNPVLPCPDSTVTVTMSVPQGNATAVFDRVTTGSFTLHVGP